MDNTSKKILDIVTDIQEQMVTKNDLEKTRLELQRQITKNTKAVADLSEQIRNILGYAKEIDALMNRISAIEKHLGLKIN